jgi:hypothetical protein
VAATVEFYEQVLSAFPDTESLTVLVASGVTRVAVLAGLGADLSSPTEAAWDTDERSTAWAAVEVPGGVLAVEMSGYGDPSLADLGSLSKAGAAAVVRGNIQAHYRFGCARAGELVFDDDEFIYVDDPGRVPAELRPLFDAAWDDLADDDGAERADPFASGLAMAELVTGLELTEDQVTAVLESGFFSAPSLRYPDAEAAEVEPAVPATVKLDPGVRKVDSGQVWTGDGLYMLISSWDFSFEQEEPPEGASEGFGLTLGDHTAWVSTLNQRSTSHVSLTVLSSQVEPTATLENLRAAYTDESTGLVVARANGLRAIGEYNNHGLAVTDDEGTFVLHVFARRGEAVGETFVEEEHVLVVWPAPAG